MSDEPLALILIAVERLERGFDQLEGGNERLSEGHVRLARGQERLRVDLMAWMDRLDRAHVAAEHTSDEMRLLSEEVSAMQRQIQRLQTDMR
jgi:hypothetical protein